MLLRLITLLNLQHLVDNDATPAQPPGTLGAGGCGQRKQGSKLRGVSKEVSHLVQKQEKWCVSTFANAGQEWNTQSSLPSGGAGAAVLTLGLIQPGCAAAEQGPHKALGVPSTPKQHNGALPNPPAPGSTSVVALGSRMYSLAAAHRFSGKDGNLHSLLSINLYIFSWANTRLLKFHKNHRIV